MELSQSLFSLLFLSPPASFFSIPTSSRETSGLALFFSHSPMRACPAEPPSLFICFSGFIVASTTHLTSRRPLFVCILRI